MSVGPLRRSIGGLGLLALTPVAIMVAAGTLDPVEAAQRAVLTLIVLFVLGRLATWGVHGIASVIEQEGSRSEPDAEPSAAPLERSRPASDTEPVTPPVGATE